MGKLTLESRMTVDLKAHKKDRTLHTQLHRMPGGEKLTDSSINCWAQWVLVQGVPLFSLNRIVLKTSYIHERLCYIQNIRCVTVKIFINCPLSLDL